MMKIKQRTRMYHERGTKVAKAGEKTKVFKKRNECFTRKKNLAKKKK